MSGLRQAVFAVVAGFCMLLPLRLPAQTSPAAPAADPKVERGKEWFYQRCSLCHLGRVLKNETHQPMGPSLVGVLKDSSPAREAAVRQQIQKGSLRMPGFQYGLTAEELDELVAYLKTM